VFTGQAFQSARGFVTVNLDNPIPCADRPAGGIIFNTAFQGAGVASADHLFTEAGVLTADFPRCLLPGINPRNAMSEGFLGTIVVISSRLQTPHLNFRNMALNRRKRGLNNKGSSDETRLLSIA